MQQHSIPTEQRGGKRKSTGKRKISDEPDGRQQQTISELLSKANSSGTFSTKDREVLSLSSNKKPRANSPITDPTVPSRIQARLISPEKMYTFPNSNTQPNDAPGQRASVPNGTPRPTKFTPHSGAKKLVVKNLRTGPRLDQDAYFKKVWVQLDTALTEVFDSTKPTTSLEELYKGAENVCRQGRSAMLADKLQERCKAYVTGKLKGAILSFAEDGDNIDALRATADAWAAWNSKLVTIRWIFYYLDQSFLLHAKELPIITEMGTALFRDHIFQDNTLKPKILCGACNLIEADRKGPDSTFRLNPGLLKKAIKLFHELGVYNIDFEPLLIKNSETFFQAWADKETNEYLATYAENCHRLIEREVSRCDLFSLNRSTQQQLSVLLDEHLIHQQEDVLLKESDVLGLMRTANKIALEQLYSLLERRRIGVRLRSSFSAYIVEEGSAIVFDHEHESEMVIRLLEFKQQLNDMWTESFHKNETLGHVLREAFETFMNKGKKSDASWGTDNPKTGEMIAKYVDMLLKGGLRAIGMKPDDPTLGDEDIEINKQLDNVLDLFRFVHGKAVFEAFYKNDLARRLLMGRSASDDAEKNMLSRLKTECGSSFTHNLESMFKDMDLARDEMSSYNNLQRERKERVPLDLNVSVLSSAAWPSYPDVPVRIPRDIAKATNDFEQFYASKYNGRKLMWKHQLAHCQLRASFPKGDKEIVVSSFQAIVLLLFNDISADETLSYSQIQEATGLSERELKRTLQSLACAKYRVLTKKPKGKDVNESDEFSYNASFSDPKMRIKINQIQLKETKEENKTTHERVAADRHYETQAAIVRIMKSRKVIRHGELVSEVIKATHSRGVLEPAEIKKNIEKLIEKDYMEREEGTNRYSYLA